MALKYQEKLTSWNIENLSDSALDGKFVSKATAFEASLKKGTLSPEEIEATDTELCELFDTLHDFEEVDNSEVTQMKEQILINEVKTQVQNCNDLTELTDLANKYGKYPEITRYIDVRVDQVKAEIAKEQKEAQEKAEQEAEQAKAHQEKEKKSAEANTLKEKLLQKRDWTYDQLRELGITPSGDDMQVEGVILTRVYMFKAYKVTGVRA
jgi:phenylalanyl-tRNA synthetase alpha subunit